MGHIQNGVPNIHNLVLHVLSRMIFRYSVSDIDFICALRESVSFMCEDVPNQMNPDKINHIWLASAAEL